MTPTAHVMPSLSHEAGGFGLDLSTKIITTLIKLYKTNEEDSFYWLHLGFSYRMPK